MIKKDVTVNVKKLTSPQSAADFGTLLLVSTETTKAYKEYSDAAGVSTDYGSTSETYKAAEVYFGQSPKPQKIAVLGVMGDGAEGIVGALNLTVGKNPGWYYLGCINHVDEYVKALDSWASANKKIFVTAVNANYTVTLRGERSVVIVHDHPETYPDMAWAGMFSTYQPGSATAKFKTLNGIAPVEFEDQATELELIHSDNYNTYVTKYGVNMLSEGLSAGGEYIDITVGVDWIQVDMEERIMQALINNPKIPYDSTGIAKIGAKVIETLKKATVYDILRKDDGGNGIFEVHIPRIEDISANDIQSRKLRDITWTATLAGAVHDVMIEGTVVF